MYICLIYFICHHIVTLVTVLGVEQFVFMCKVFFLQTWAAEVPSISRPKNWSFLRQKKDKSRWLLSSLFNLQHTNKDENSYTHIFGDNPATSKLSCIWNKLEIIHQHELVQHHQDFWYPVLEQHKVGAIFQFTTRIPNLLQVQQLRCGVVENCMSHKFSRANVIRRKKSVFCFWPLKSVVLLKAKYQIQLVEKLKSKHHPNTDKAFT